MACNCNSFGDIPFVRKEVSKRIKETKGLRVKLEVVILGDDEEHVLFKCPSCNQFWQLARAWVSGNEPYLFRVPSITKGEWIRERYQDPDELLDYVVNIKEFDNLPSGDSVCKVNGCEKQTVKGLRVCHKHHVFNMQSAKACLSYPVGRKFPPYDVRNYEA